MFLMIFLSVIDICGYYLEYSNSLDDDFVFEDVSYYYPTIVRVSARPRKLTVVGLLIFWFLIVFLFLPLIRLFKFVFFFFYRDLVAGLFDKASASVRQVKLNGLPFGLFLFAFFTRKRLFCCCFAYLTALLFLIAGIFFGGFYV